jgi:DNA-3-methyladenine glycosylase
MISKHSVMAQLPRDFFDRDARLLAPLLLNKLIGNQDGRIGRIVEVEAYCGAQDQAAHSWRGPTPRTQVMFGPAGHLYVYLVYGLHRAVNIVAGGEPGSAVLIRALEPYAGIEAMRSARGVIQDSLIASGPGRLTQALGITLSHNGLDITDTNVPIQVVSDGMEPAEPVISKRIGIARDKDKPWRWYVPGNAHISKK